MDWSAHLPPPGPAIQLAWTCSQEMARPRPLAQCTGVVQQATAGDIRVCSKPGFPGHGGKLVPRSHGIHQQCQSGVQARAIHSLDSTCRWEVRKSRSVSRSLGGRAGMTWPLVWLMTTGSSKHSIKWLVNCVDVVWCSGEDPHHEPRPSPLARVGGRRGALTCSLPCPQQAGPHTLPASMTQPHPAADCTRPIPP